MYLYSTRELCMNFCCTNETVIDSYVDSDFAGDTQDRRSTTGFVVRVHGNPILWKSVKQGVVTRA